MALQHHVNNRILVAGSIMRALRFPLSDAIANQIAASATTVEVSVYSGAQPTPALFEANWSTAHNSSNASFLAHFTGVALSQPGQAALLQIVLNTSTATPANSGLALWAVIWGGAVSSNLAGATIPNDRYMIVPVSDANGSGVVRFNNNNLVSGTPVTIVDCTISINL